MWNRLLISLLLLLGSQALFSQTWLNKTDKDILLYISENKERIEDSKQTDTLFTLTCQEEDELGRLFEVSYRFNLEKMYAYPTNVCCRSTVIGQQRCWKRPPCRKPMPPEKKLT